ncbi:MAG: helix-turn-helix transcriptional regulator [Firmicutes bacterium]|nr:helix-turn-helix transcriptional regulator [Bacillota bacterium]
MDYFLIGQQIRKYRKAMGLSQEQLAERIGISVTHMSHIETGNTKLSLPVFVDIARALEVATDDLLDTAPNQRSSSYAELTELLDGCSARQLRMLTDVVKAVKVAMDKHMEPGE